MPSTVVNKMIGVILDVVKQIEKSLRQFVFGFGARVQSNPRGKQPQPLAAALALTVPELPLDAFHFFDDSKPIVITPSFERSDGVENDLKSHRQMKPIENPVAGFAGKRCRRFYVRTAVGHECHARLRHIFSLPDKMRDTLTAIIDFRLNIGMTAAIGFHRFRRNHAEPARTLVLGGILSNIACVHAHNYRWRNVFPWRHCFRYIGSQHADDLLCGAVRFDTLTDLWNLDFHVR